MKVEVCEGEERWIFEGGVLAANYYGCDERTAEIAIKTPMGEVLLHLHPGEPECEFDMDEFEAALERRFKATEMGEQA